MSLPMPWVQRIFDKLTVTFGRDFLGRWEGLDINTVMEDWADELAGFQQTPDAIKYGLEHIPSDKAPTVQQFRDICRKTPQYLPKALPAPTPDPALAKAVRQAFKPVAGYGDRAWAEKLKARIDSKEIRPTMYQREAVAEVLGREPTGDA